MPRARVGEVELEYAEVLPDGVADPDTLEPLVMIMGIGAQMVLWPRGLLDELASRGFRVIIFDNRDVGASTWLDHLPVPKPVATMGRAVAGMAIDAPYTLVDMADDVAGLLDHLGLATAHVLGASMGGMIAQTLAITHPHRVRSLTSIMSSPGGRRYSLAKPHVLKTLLQPAPRDPLQAEENALRFYAAAGSTAFERDEAGVRERARLSFERGVHPKGFARHFAAILATGKRGPALRFFRRPSLVIHGSVDPLILPHAGRATARALPDAELLLIDGMGHDLPRGVWPTVVEGVERVARRGPPSPR